MRIDFFESSRSLLDARRVVIRQEEGQSYVESFQKNLDTFSEWVRLVVVVLIRFMFTYPNVFSTHDCRFSWTRTAGTIGDSLLISYILFLFDYFASRHLTRCFVNASVCLTPFVLPSLSNMIVLSMTVAWFVVGCAAPSQVAWWCLGWACCGRSLPARCPRRASSARRNRPT